MAGGGPLVLWCDYGGQTTWRYVDGGPRVEPVDVDELGLTSATIASLDRWCSTFERLTWPSDAEPPVAPDPSEWDAFLREGERLRSVLIDELGVEVVLDQR